MPPTQKPNPCAELKQTYDQLLSEKQKFNALMAEINFLRPNIGKNISDIKSRILDMQNIRTEIEDKIFEIFYNSENNSDNARTAIKKYGSKIFGRIEKKIVNQQELNTTEVILLYDVKDKIVPVLSEEQQQKIKEIRNKRDKKADAPIVFACQPQEIAWGREQINKNTKVYIGPLFSQFFTKFAHLEHVCTDFPEGIIRKYNIEIGGITKEQLQENLKIANINFESAEKYLFKNEKFITSPNTKIIKLILLTVKDLGFPENQNQAETEAIYKRASKLGLYLCPAEVGPHLRLQYSGGEWIMIAMKKIWGSDRYFRMFGLNSNITSERLYLSAYTDRRWSKKHHWVFSLGESDS